MYGCMWHHVSKVERKITGKHEMIILSICFIKEVLQISL